jgi:hypothetical protein
MINTAAERIPTMAKGKGKLANFKGKKAAPFAKGGGRKKSSTKTARGKKK